eukprot:1196289-Prorocentrum_minimum.AAC.4
MARSAASAMPTRDRSSCHAGAASSSRGGSAQGAVAQEAVGLARRVWLVPPRGAPSALSCLAARGGARCRSRRTLPRLHLKRGKTP